MSYKRIRSLERGVAILQVLNKIGSATAGEIAREVGMPRPTVYRILDTLVENGLIYNSPSSHKVYRLAEAVRKLSENLEVVDPITAAIHDGLGSAPDSLPWPVFLSTYSDDGMVIRETTRGSSVFWTELGWMGAVAPVWEVAAGIAYAAFCSVEQQARLLESAPADAADVIIQVREQGYAQERDENGRLAGMAVPVGAGDSILGALAIFWEVNAGSEESLVARYLPVLIGLRDAILEKLPSQVVLACEGEPN